MHPFSTPWKHQKMNASKSVALIVVLTKMLKEKIIFIFISLLDIIYYFFIIIYMLPLIMCEISWMIKIYNTSLSYRAGWMS